MTSMKPKAISTLIIVALMLTTIVKIGTAQDQVNIVAGVKPGDQFTYGVTGNYSSNAAITDIPIEVLNAQASVYFIITIANVSNPKVGYTYLWHFVNGTELTGDGTVDLEIPSEDVGPFSLIVSANLTTGESIHPHFGIVATFNETVMWTYTNYTRETNRLETQFVEQRNQTTPIRYRAVNRDSYFDKQTGMLVQFDEQSNYENPTFTTEITWKLIGQNVWTSESAGSYLPSSLFSIPNIIIIIVVMGVVAAIAGWFISNKRRAARRKQLLKKR